MESPLSTRCAILQTLRVQRRGYAAGIIAHVRTLSAGRITLREGTVYPLLQEFEREGLVEAETAAGPAMRAGRTGRTGRAYVLTARGVQAAENEAAMLLALLGHASPGPTPGPQV